MSERNDQPAFPAAEDHKIAADIPWTAGMSLRDWFAGQALTRLADATDTPLAAAQWAYTFADAMLAAREAKP